MSLVPPAGAQAPEQTLVQLSDLHILPPGQLLHGVVDTFANLEAATEVVAASAVHWLGSTRVIVLDSTIPGHHHGALAPAQLAWLSAELARPAEQGTVLMLHHPPLPSPVPPVDLLRLRDAERLADVLAGSDVRIILSGHAHHVSGGSLAGIPVWVAPAVAYAIDTMPPRGRQRGTVGGAFSRIDLIRGTAVATVVPIAATTSVYDRDEAEMVRMVTDVVARAG